MVFFYLILHVLELLRLSCHCSRNNERLDMEQNFELLMIVNKCQIIMKHALCYFTGPKETLDVLSNQPSEKSKLFQFITYRYDKEKYQILTFDNQ